MVDSVLLDLYGVLIDHELTKQRYGRRLAAILTKHSGGDAANWIRAHETAWTEYVQMVKRHSFWEGRPYKEALKEADVSYLRRLFSIGGAPLPDSDPFAFARRLEELVVEGIPAAYPESRETLRELKDLGVEVVVATGASLNQARAALRGNGLQPHVDFLLTADLLDSSKEDVHFWQRAYRSLRRKPWECLVADDALTYLRPAVREGGRGVWIARRGTTVGRPHFPLVATLGSLRGLPILVRRLRD